MNELSAYALAPALLPAPAPARAAATGSTPARPGGTRPGSRRPVRWTAAPRPPRPGDCARLRALTARVAAEVRAGRHPVRVDPDKRWYHRLHGDDYLDVWLISWSREQAAELHDHAGSLGALTVVRGELTEHRWGGRLRPGLRTRALTAGRTVSFGPGHVHDVVNRRVEPAISVHAYSPPLTAMSYYALVPGGVPRRIRTELTLGTAS